MCTHTSGPLPGKPSLPHSGQGTLTSGLFCQAAASSKTASGFRSFVSLLTESLPSEPLFPQLSVLFCSSCVSAAQLYSSSSLPCCLSGPPDHMIAFLPREALLPSCSENKPSSGPWEPGLFLTPRVPLSYFLPCSLLPWDHLPLAILAPVCLRAQVVLDPERLCSPAAPGPSALPEGLGHEVGLGSQGKQAQALALLLPGCVILFPDLSKPHFFN